MRPAAATETRRPSTPPVDPDNKCDPPPGAFRTSESVFASLLVAVGMILPAGAIQRPLRTRESGARLRDATHTAAVGTGKPIGLPPTR